MSSRRRTILVALLMTVLGVGVGPVPAVAADDDPDVRVTIRSLDPSLLSPGADVTMTGTVTNADQHAWTAVQAYLVIPASPFTTRGQVDDARANDDAYTGDRVISAGAFDEVGDLAPGQTARFRMTVPYEQLGITGAEGVYPVGVQILATDDEGVRTPAAIARATTFMPLMTSSTAPVPTSLVWPFLMSDHRTADGTYADPAALLQSVGPGGQLRNLLDLARSTPAAAGTVLIDPALLVGVDDLAQDRRQPDDATTTDDQRALASQFLQDLLGFARARSVWVLDFDRPDVLALSDNPDLRRPIQEAIDTTTESALNTYQLSGRRVAWPTRNGVTKNLLVGLRGRGDSPVVVTPGSLPDWDHRLGSVVQYETSGGPVPLLVDSLGDEATSRPDSVVTLRQRLLSDAAVAGLERAIDAGSRADSVVLVDPTWDPGARWSTGDLSAAFAAPFVQPTSLDSVLTRTLETYDGTVPRTAKARPLSRAQLAAAADIVAKGRTLSSIISQSEAVDASLARTVAEAVSVRWRLDRAKGYSIASARARGTGAELDKISIEAPPSVTLSSAKGGFPLTIRNDTAEAIRIGVDLDSSNPALTIPTVDAVDVGAGERLTVTVQIDLGTQRATDLTAHLLSKEGETFGKPTTFKVRSSSIGTVLWVAMGLAGAFVLVALARRFHRRRTRGPVSAATPPPDDDD